MGKTNLDFFKYCEEWERGMFLRFWVKLPQHKIASNNFFDFWLKPS